MNKIKKLRLVKQLASRYGATDVQPSTRKNKKYMVTYKGNLIHYGDTRYDDYLDHNDTERRHNYRARASKIKTESGQLTYKNKLSPNFWSIHTLWP